MSSIFEDGQVREPAIGNSRPGLQLITQKTKWSCLPASFAMVVAKNRRRTAVEHYLELIKYLGRDDARGFHVQEILGWCIGRGVAFTPFEFAPALEPTECPVGQWIDGRHWINVQMSTGSDEYHVCPDCGGTGWLKDPPLVLDHLSNLIVRFDGVLTGTKRGSTHPHAVAWCRQTQKVLDPEYGIYDFEGFDPTTFWACIR